MPKAVLKWLQKGWDSFLDPAKQKRVNEIAEYLRRRIAKEKKAFTLKSAIQRRDFDPDDLRLARLSVYCTYVERALDDAHLNSSERASLDWVANAIGLSTQERCEIDRETGRKVFGRVLATAVDDGEIDDAEATRVRLLAEFMGFSVSDVMSMFFSDEGEGFLRSMFLAATEDGELLRDEWSRFLSSAQRLGFSRPEAIGLVRFHAQTFVEHVLADAKSDDRISPSEESNLEWLMSELAIPQQFRDYTRREIRELQRFDEIRAGRLPSLTQRIPVELRAGEIVHYYGPAVFQRFRELKSGTKVDLHEGQIVITDSRLIFASPEKPFTLNLRSVISVQRDGRCIHLCATPKATGIYHFGDQTKLAGLILAVAVGRANQTIVDSGAATPGRHIPRDVRQRVWQRYAGRCVDCGAADYLEFDHIIPVAKGGSNDENNVQLLCRRCNLTKAEHI